MDPTTRTIARIAGPTALALSATESLNLGVFAVQTAPTVYLNGTLLLVAGVAMVQAHNRWRRGWALLVTLTGWGVLALGLVRMTWPAAQQIHSGPLADAIFVALCTLGVALSYGGYVRRATEAP